MVNKVIGGLDLETTGFDYATGDRIVEACIGIYRLDDDGLRHVRTFTQRINPERTIPADAYRVHGISNEDVKLSPKWIEFAPTVDKLLQKCDLVVIHNRDFDWPFLNAAQAAAGYPIDSSKETFCTMRSAPWATFDGKSPSLQELCWSMGIEYDPSAAHAADYDVDRMMQCYAKGVALNLFQTN